MKSIDSLTYSTFVKKFNEQYDSKLLSEQKDLLNRYISSFSNDDLEMKIYLNRELGRLKESLEKAAEVEEIATDPEMTKKTQLVKDRLQKLSNETTLNEATLFTILKTQELVKEIYNGSNS